MAAFFESEDRVDRVWIVVVRGERNPREKEEDRRDTQDKPAWGHAIRSDPFSRSASSTRKQLCCRKFDSHVLGNIWHQDS